MYEGNQGESHFGSSYRESTVPPQPLSTVAAVGAKICRRGGNHMHDMQGVDPDRLPSYYIERNG